MKAVWVARFPTEAAPVSRSCPREYGDFPLLNVLLSPRRVIACRGQFPAFAPKHAESPAVLRIRYGHNQLSFRSTVVTGSAFSALKGLRNLNSHMGQHSKWPARLKAGGLTQCARYASRDPRRRRSTRTGLKSGYQGRFGDQSMPTLLLLGNGSAAQLRIWQASCDQ